MLTEQTIRFHRSLCDVRLVNDLPNDSNGGTAREEANRALQRETEASDRARIGQEHAVQLLDMCEAIRDRLDELEQRRAQSINEMQQLAVELAVAMTAHLVQHKIETGDAGLEALVASAMEQLLPHGTVTVALHPQDLAMLEARQAEWLKDVRSSGQASIVADATLPRGGCRADAGEIGLWSTFEQRLSHLREELVQGIDYAQTERRQTEGDGATLRRFPDRRETA